MKPRSCIKIVSSDPKICNDLKGFEHLHRYKTTKRHQRKKKAPGTKPGLLEIYGPEGIRTLDLYSAIVALSQLSYRPGSKANDSDSEADCQANVPLIPFIPPHFDVLIRTSYLAKFLTIKEQMFYADLYCCIAQQHFNIPVDRVAY